MASVNVFDVIVIGGGYAGLSTALTAYRANHQVAVFDSGDYRTTKGSPLHILPTFDYKQPEDFRANGRAELLATGRVQFIDASVADLAKLPNGRWQLTDGAGKQWFGRTVVLATGVDDVLPQIPGYAECWVNGMYGASPTPAASIAKSISFPCMFQFGYEESGAASAGIIAVDRLAKLLPHTVMLVSDAKRFAKEVTIYTAGNEEAAAGIRKLLAEKGDTETTVDSREIRQLTKGKVRAEVHMRFADGTDKTEGFLVHQPDTKLRGTLADDLGLEKLPSGEIKVAQPFPETSVPGVFAAGDCASPLKVASLAISSGVLAGNGVSRKVAMVA